MSHDQRKKVEAIFQRAMDLAEGERESFLASQCGDDASLRAEVHKLLEPSESIVDQFLATPVFSDTDREATESVAHLPARIGRYTIVQKVGDGGMGVVYEAKQESPGRTVALKVIRPGHATAAMRRRFAHEVEVLGRLQHPGIAHVYEAGMAVIDDDGGGEAEHPFFAMEFIRGMPLTQHAEENALDTSDRLELVATICDAVHYAHQQGVIHRDLKPSNILVDTAGRPKILDFGVARVSDAEQQGKTLQTGAGQLIGTLPYMSPEQVSGDSRLVDTASDVYALGVILFQMLAGRLPHQLTDRSIPEAARIIRDEEPSSLSAFNTTFRGDIDTIVTKAIDKEKTRRYASAAELGADIRRFLRDEPIVARRTSTYYQVRKFAKRNKALVGGVVATFLALSAGLIGMAFLARQEARQRAVAEHARAGAEKEAAKARAVNEFLNEMLAQANPTMNPSGAGMTVSDALDLSAAKVATSFSGQPEVEAAVRTTIGIAFRDLARFDDSETHLLAALKMRRRAHGDMHGDVADSLLELASLYRELGRYEETEKLLTEALATNVALFGERDVRVAHTRTAIGTLYLKKGDRNMAASEYELALPVLKEAYGENNEHVASCMDNLGQAIKRSDGFEMAESMFKSALAIRRRILPPNHPKIAYTLNNLGHLYRTEDRLDEAEALLSEALKILCDLLGPDHPDVAVAIGNLVAVHVGKRELDKALELSTESLRIKRLHFGEDHPRVAQAYNDLGYLMYRNKEYDRSEQYLKQALAVFRKVKGNEDFETATALNNLQYLYTATKQYGKAEAAAREALDIVRGLFAEDHSTVLLLSKNVATVLSAKGDLDGALALREEVLQKTRRSVPEGDPRIVKALLPYAQDLLAAGNATAAEKLLRESVEIREMSLPLHDWRTDNAKSLLGECLVRLNRFAEAEALLVPSFEGLRSTLGDSDSKTAEAALRIVALYEAWGRPDLATKYRAPDEAGDERSFRSPAGTAP